MHDVLGFLFGLAIVLTAVACIGHAIWVLTAKTIGAILASSEISTPSSSGHCPECAARIKSGEENCSECDAFLGDPQATLERDIASVSRQLHRLRRDGRLTEADRRRLLQLMHDDQMAILSGDSPASSAAVTPGRDSNRSTQLEEVETEQREFSPQQSEPTQPVEIVDFVSTSDEKQPDTRSDSSHDTSRSTQSSKKESPKRPSSRSPRARSEELPRDGRAAPRRRAVVPSAPTTDDTQSDSLRSRKPAAAAMIDAEMPERKTVGELALRFMEKRNIRWGEIISGLLIVGCATGLVISLWSTLDSIPYFPALLFMLVTLALHGAGRYTLSRWKLQSTSQGLLLISTVLIPLNFVAGVAVSRGDLAIANPIYLAAVIVGLGVFSAVSWSSGKRLFLRQPALLLLAIVGPCVGQLAASRLLPAEVSNSRLWVCAGIAVAPLALALGMQSLLVTHWKRITNRRVSQSILIASTGTFSSVIALAVTVWKSGALAEALQMLSPLLSIVPIMILTLLLVLHRRLHAGLWPGWRIALQAGVILAAMVMGWTLLLAWPNPARLLAISLTSFAFLLVVARMLKAGFLYLPAALSGAFATTLAGLLLDGALSMSGATSQSVFLALVSARSSAYVFLFSLPLGIAGWKNIRWKGEQVSESEQALRIAHMGLVAMCAVAATRVAGFASQDIALATIIMMGCSLVGVFVAAAVQRRSVTVAAAGLFWLAGLLQAERVDTVTQWLSELLGESRSPSLAATLVFCTFATVASALLSRFRPMSTVRENVWQPLTWVSLGLTLLALPGVYFEPELGRWIAARDGIWIVLIWLVALIVHPSRRVLWTAQFLSALAAVQVNIAVSMGAEWWPEQASLAELLGTYQYLHHLAAAMISLSVLWYSLRYGFKNRHPLWTDSPLSFERMLLALTSLSVSGFTAICVLPSAVSEIPLRVDPGQIATTSLLSLCLWSGMVGIACWFLCRSVFASDHILAGAFAGIVTVVFAMTAGTESGLLQSDFASFSQDWVGHWATWALVAALIILGGEYWRSHRGLHSLAPLLVSASVVPLLVATAGTDAIGTASILRWEFALVALALPVFELLRRRIPQAAFAVDDRSRPAAEDSSVARLSITRTDVPVWFLTMAVIGITLRYLALVLMGDNAPSVSVGTVINYVIPVLIAAAAGAVLSFNMRSSRHLVGNLWFLPVSSGLAYLLWNSSGLRSAQLDSVASFRFFASTAVMLAVVTILTRAAVGRLPGWTQDTLTRTEKWLGSDIGVCLLGLMMIPTVICVVFSPAEASSFLESTGDFSLLGALVVLTLSRLSPADRRLSDKTLTGGQCAIAAGIVWAACACTNTGFTIEGDPGADLVLAIGFAVQAVVTVGLHAFAARSTQKSAARGLRGVEKLSLQWARGLCIGSSVLAVRLIVVSPEAEVWFVIVSGMIWAALFGAGIVQRTRTEWLATAVIVSGSVILRAVYGTSVPEFGERGFGALLIRQLLIANSVNLAVWQCCEVWFIRLRGGAFFPLQNDEESPVGNAVQVVMFIQALFCFAVWNDVSDTLSGNFDGYDIAIAGSAVGNLLLALTSGAVAASGLLALSVVYISELTVLRLFDVDESHRTIVLTIMMSANAFVVSVLIRGSESMAPFLRSLGARWPVGDGRKSIQLLTLANMAAGVAIVAIGFSLVLNDSLSWHRIAAAGATLLLAPMIALLASDDSRVLKIGALLVGGVGTIQLGWAFMSPEFVSHEFLHRSVRSFATIAAYGAFLATIGSWLSRRSETWVEALRKASVVLALAGLGNLAITLGVELSVYLGSSATPLTTLEIATVGSALILLAGLLIVIALRPERDPLGLTGQARTFYVYAAEAVSALLFLHLYLTVPELFTGALRKYWPFIVMAIAYIGVSVGELLERARVRVISEPLQNTGILLPLLPAIALWNSTASGLPLFMFLLGLMYVMVSFWKQSFGFACAAVVAGNAALWALYDDRGLELLSRPQMYLIPPAVSLLVAAQLSRDRIAETQLTAIRYFSMLVIYVSSTGEMFIEGIAEQTWRPILLALLSVAGVFTGILLRIRSFLYLGTSFLVLAIVSMVWHATLALDHSWPWWVFGIGLGMLILTVFGLFEKRRNDMQRLIGELRAWDR